MKSGSSLPIEQHNIEIQINRAIWERKPALRAVYRGFYEQIAAATTSRVPGQTVELGSGMGNIKQFLPHCVTTDIFNNTWLDRVETAYALSFSNSSVANLILFDVFHHLEFPGNAFEEAARVVAPGGRMIIFDQDMSLLSRWICRVFHHEPVSMGKQLRWNAPVDFSTASSAYYAATENAYRCFVRGELSEQRAAKWKLVECRRICSFAWLGCGGFRGKQLYPAGALPLIRLVDRLLSHLPDLFSSRLLVVLERQG
jgi:SAM-dependent methyltransferase